MTGLQRRRQLLLNCRLAQHRKRICSPTTQAIISETVPLTRASLRCQNLGAFAIEITSNPWQADLVWCAVDCRRILIIFRFAQSRALSRKVSDEFTVPLCRGHHRELHRNGNEAGWWGQLGIDAVEIARALWLEGHPLPKA